ncbi:hypothetical protein BK131_20060 [Paenibacillus amylolyticus]|uniref:Uncharacterized protein n=1 Tax=Paenibacillus amylolyticus TaxID=1451 RepID=A0A1R1BPT5_PAEAM|nr:hypothetical protein [Paenibacillus amylolyticus]OMF11771.1 hypothetical protein BK131_20060 [Paenibacillus amylolyticus]
MKTKSEKLPTLFLLIYAVLMLISYSIYLFLENARLSQSQQWLSEGTLTQDDVNSISQIGRWTTISESAFLILFVIGFIFVMYQFQKKPLKHFLIFNAALFIGVALISYVVSLASSMPIGNSVQPVIIPTFLLVALCIYTFWRTRNGK